jgi:acyl-coenzyme A thioesterase PaaI-like protein
MSDPVEGAGEEKRVTHWNASEMEASGAWAEKRRLAAAMRVVIERLMTSDAPEGELRAAADALERYAERLATHPRADRYFGFAESANAGNVLAFFDQSPIIGRANPIAPPVVMRAEGGRVLGTARFGSAYEGPPGCVHGGYVAAAFDEVLGYAETFSGAPGMTGTLNVVYRSPTPLHDEVVFRAKIEKIEGRKIYVHGTLHAGERLCAESDAIFVSMRPGRYLELMEERRKRPA